MQTELIKGTQGSSMPAGTNLFYLLEQSICSNPIETMEMENNSERKVNAVPDRKAQECLAQAKSLILPTKHLRSQSD